MGRMQKEGVKDVTNHEDRTRDGEIEEDRERKKDITDSGWGIKNQNE